MVHPNKRIFFAFSLLASTLLPVNSAIASWYVGPGLTNLNLSTSRSTVSLDALATLTGGASGGTADVKSGSTVPSLSIGRTFGENKEWLVETTISTGFDETVTVGDANFATAKIFPLSIFGAYQATPYSVENSTVTFRPVLGAGLSYVMHSDITLSNPAFAASGADLSFSNSLGFSALAGVNVGINKQVSGVLGLVFITGINTDVSLGGALAQVPFVNAPDIQLGGVKLNAVALNARIQYLF